MSLDHDEIQREYIDRILELRQQRDESLTPEDLQEVARDLGLTEADLAAAEQAARDHLARGERYLEHGRCDDAVAELTDAAALAPGWLEAALRLAEAHAARHAARPNGADQAAAQRWARRCLELDPECEAAYELLNRVDQPVKGAVAPVVRQRPNAALVMALIIAFTILFGLLAALIVTPSSDVVVPQPPPIVAPVPEVAPLPEAAVPVELVAGEAADIAFETRTSELSVYPTSCFYRLTGLVTNTGTTELHALKVRLELRDAAGATVGADVVEVIGTADSALRPGDTALFEKLHQTEPSVARAVLRPETAEQRPAAASYPAATPLPVDWLAQPAGVEVTFAERAKSLSTNRFRDGQHFRATLEVTNRGATALGTLKVQVRYLDAGGAVSETSERLIAHLGGVPLWPGETRLVELINQVPAGVVGYQLQVLEAAN